ncbi:tRNA (adenosine(37)-N6)-threonylcarbamoyltransferase complex dimerization subunit type 1 TsaB [uncultured Corynebacterium sp.]|uniref:tRNA (adenosine(37)-N6)-threonylcarbamoyltransferase complex dimerization subunit type 1 TsaB n=1 Tax=uncultured Corynebacterium sp. TaxID=159447 RepID=UPI0025DA691A|nr:tRNA (adenosine(37)-N6)-threonylcarbamoyltransferase complex dimerization subunit type 1 TsaB [uncultured Corynebacterium sp.]
MLVLAVDTSTPQVTAGLVRVTDSAALEEVAAAGHVDARAHNEVLTPLIRRCLEEAGAAGVSGGAASEVGAVVVGCGPGPFTGLRVGMATAASFADAWGIPAHGACSLDALVRPGGVPAAGDVVAVTDARRREVYAAAYRDGERVWGPAVLAAADCSDAVFEAVPDFALAELIGDESKCAEVAAAFTLGDVSDRAEPRVTAAYPTAAGLVSAAVAELALEHDDDGAPSDAASAFRATDALASSAAPLVPLYLRRPDATPPKPKPKSPAIPDMNLDAGGDAKAGANAGSDTDAAADSSAPEAQ